MLIENVKVEFFKISKELLSLNGKQECTMRILRKLLFIFSTDFKMLFSISSHSTHLNVINLLLKNDIKELFSYDTFSPAVPYLVKIQIVLKREGLNQIKKSNLP